MYTTFVSKANDVTYIYDNPINSILSLEENCMEFTMIRRVEFYIINPIQTYN